MAELGSNGHDRIRILLVDDKPVGLRVGAPPGVENPWMPQQYADHFEFRWLATPEEARTFRDLTWALAERDLPLLVRKGWVPEIAALDYLLLDDTHTVSERMGADPRELGSLSPLPDLLEAARVAQLPEHVVQNDEVAEEVVAQRLKGDSWGCFVGGLLLSTLSDHPCAAVPITRYLSANLIKESPDTWFFEWLMTAQTGGMLRGNGVAAAKWQTIIEQGVKGLQERIRQLATCRLVTLDLDELAALATPAGHPVLTIHTRFGARRLPTAGLFINDPSTMRPWADGLLGELAAPGDWAGLHEAREHAEDLLRTYDNEERVWDRIELSSLLRRKERREALSVEDARRLAALISQFGASVEEDTDPQRTKWITGEVTRLVADIRDLNLDGWRKKWVALIIILNLLKRFATGWDRGMPFEDITEAEVYLALCPVARHPIILPFSDGSRRSFSSDMPSVETDIGFSVKNVLSGGGLSTADRTLLMHVATTLGLGRDVWARFPRIRHIIAP